MGNAHGLKQKMSATLKGVEHQSDPYRIDESYERCPVALPLTNCRYEALTRASYFFDKKLRDRCVIS